jgi:16S rRNA (guanine527-N7)-methyltransferase
MAIQLQMIEQWNAKLNLVGPGNPASWISRHSLDSLVALVAMPSEGHVLDLGSGAGFPGIPLALMRPDATFSLAERRSKRRAFIQNVVAAVGAANVSVIPEAEVEESYDLVLGRAVLPVAEWLAYGTRRAKVGGLVGHFAQEDAEVPLTMSSSIGLQHVGERTYVLPGQPMRRFIWFQKLVPRETR